VRLTVESLNEHFTKVYGVLIEKAGAPPSYSDSFLPFAADWWNNNFWSTKEFRFMGKLGMGGKIWLDPEGYRVSCYSEDRTPEREKILKDVNSDLMALFMPNEDRLE
jgi:hypothetical protein